MSKKADLIRREIQMDRVKRAAMCNGWEREAWFVDLDKGKKLEGVELRQFILDYFQDDYLHQFDLEGTTRNSVGYLCERFTPDVQALEVSLRPTAIVLYGADYMPTRKIIKYFSYFEPLNITWLDDSSCEIEFSSVAQTKRAIYENGSDFTKKTLFEQELTTDFETKTLKEQLKWFELAPYYEMAFERKLQARFATTAEKTGFDPEQAQMGFYAARRRSFLDLYAKEKFKQTSDRLYQERREKWGRSENHHRNNRNDRNEPYRPDRRDHPCYARRSHNNSFEHNNSFPRNRDLNESQLEPDMSKFNYSFHRNPNIKQEIDNQPPEQDQSMCSFERRFENLTLQENFNISRQQSFRKCNKQQQDESDRILNESFQRAEPQVKEESLNESLSFKKRAPEVIEIDDD